MPEKKMRKYLFSSPSQRRLWSRVKTICVDSSQTQSSHILSQSLQARWAHGDLSEVKQWLERCRCFLGAFFFLTHDEHAAVLMERRASETLVDANLPARRGWPRRHANTVWRQFRFWNSKQQPESHRYRCFKSPSVWLSWQFWVILQDLQLQKQGWKKKHSAFRFLP